MESVLLGVAALACPVGMGAMMWFMAKGMRKDGGDRQQPVATSLEQLREEHERLGEQIERMQGSERTATRS